MGIDRKDVRIVCHFNIPKSMEAFYQESGRAGRDQLPSRSVLYYGLDDRKRMEFILGTAVSKKSQSSSSSNSLSKKSLADFKQMVDYCEGFGCRRKKILENFGEQVSASFCQKTCDACKHPNMVSARLEELNRVPRFDKKDGLAPVFIKSASVASYDGLDCEFWNRDDEASDSDEDISSTDDEADAINSLARSKLSSKAGFDEKFEALQQAEEAYYQDQLPKKSKGLSDKKIISDTLREASKKRLLTALNQAQERLGEQLPNIETSSTFLETECFKRYEKVGKTFYNSQVAATLRWLSSSNYEQICDRLNANTSPDIAKNIENIHTNAIISSPPEKPSYSEVPESEINRERNTDNVGVSGLCDSLQHRGYFVYTTEAVNSLIASVTAIISWTIFVLILNLD
ncbi:uncharacterized protein A4U43_C08F26840 [Asparagus officinalis]|nr:uncharacterized protein A4U43_C08F26840 [Asparagus officinalis]